MPLSISEVVRVFVVLGDQAQGGIGVALIEDVVDFPQFVDDGLVCNVGGLIRGDDRSVSGDAPLLGLCLGFLLPTIGKRFDIAHGVAPSGAVYTIAGRR